LIKPSPAKRLERAKAKLKREEQRIEAQQIEKRVKALKSQHRVKSIYRKSSFLGNILGR